MRHLAWLSCLLSCVMLAAVSCAGNRAPPEASVDAGSSRSGGDGGQRDQSQRAGSAAESGGRGGQRASAADAGGVGGGAAEGGCSSDVGCAGTCASCTAASDRSSKRGVAYDFCKGYAAQGQTDIEQLRVGTQAGSGISWFYNWGTTPGSCLSQSGSRQLEYVPMAWGLTDGGSACESGGVCFNDGLSIAQLSSNIPDGTRYLLGFNEPNFAHQSNLTPTTAARAWKHLEQIAKDRGLKLVAPATNYCDPSPSSDHAGSCTKEPAEHAFHSSAYDLSVPAGHRYNAFEWAELFYDECSSQGAAATDCQIDYQAGHVYSYWGLAWYVDAFKKKAGITPASEAHCNNGKQDEDEFASDCGGNACAACSDWARAQFSKALWLTEFAPSTDDGPSPKPSHDQLVQHTAEYIASELPKLESDGYVFRYAWFMPRTDIASLDHVDLLSEGMPVMRTAAGLAFVNEAH